VTLQALNHAFSRESRDLLLYLHATASQYIWYSGDSLLRFAGLIAAGLVSIAETKHGVGVSTEVERLFRHEVDQIPPSTTVQIELSERGRDLVKTWLEGLPVSM
jgi:hypothetical protein